MVSGLFIQFQIFWVQYLMELLEPLTVLALLNCSTWHIQGFRHGLIRLSSSRAQVLWNLRSDFWSVSLFLGNRRLRVVPEGKLSQEFWVNPNLKWQLFSWETYVKLRKLLKTTVFTWLLKQPIFLFIFLWNVFIYVLFNEIGFFTRVLTSISILLLFFNVSSICSVIVNRKNK